MSPFIPFFCMPLKFFYDEFSIIKTYIYIHEFFSWCLSWVLSEIKWEKYFWNDFKIFVSFKIELFLNLNRKSLLLEKLLKNVSIVKMFIKNLLVKFFINFFWRNFSEVTWHQKHAGEEKFMIPFNAKFQSIFIWHLNLCVLNQPVKCRKFRSKLFPHCFRCFLHHLPFEN